MFGDLRKAVSQSFEAGVLLAGGVWGSQFLIVILFALTGGYPHPIAGGVRRLASSVMGVLLCIAMQSTLGRSIPQSRLGRQIAAASLLAVASFIWSVFAFVTVHLLVGDRVPKSGSIGAIRELALNGAAAAVLFSAWFAGWTALRYRRALANSGPKHARGGLPSAGSREDQVGLSGGNQDHALWLPTEHGEKRLPFESIEYLQADHDYVRVFAQSGYYYVHRTLEGLYAKLTPGRFARVHRSFVVNLAQVTEVHRRSRGLLELILNSGVRVPVGRTYAAAVRSRFMAPQNE